MDLEDAFKLAQSATQFIRIRKNLLYTFGATRLPYICVSQERRDLGGVTVRTGEVMADKSQIAIPGQTPAIEGLEWFDDFNRDGGAREGLAVLLARRISMPPSKYSNTAGSERREPGPLAQTLERIVNHLDGENDVRTGVIFAPEQVWGLSVLLYVGSQVARSAPSNIQEHFEHLRLRGN